MLYKPINTVGVLQGAILGHCLLFLYIDDDVIFLCQTNGRFNVFVNFLSH